jgi:hypothetical protein
VKQELLILTEFTPVISGVLVVINISSTSFCTLNPTLHRLKQSSTIFVICFGKICNMFGSYKTFNHDLVY